MSVVMQYYSKHVTVNGRGVHKLFVFNLFACLSYKASVENAWYLLILLVEAKRRAEANTVKRLMAEMTK